MIAGTLEAGRRYTNARSGGTLAILKHWDDTERRLVEVERGLPPGTGKLPPHRHLDFSQTFTVIEGRMQAAIRGEKRVLQAGEALDVPQGVAHRDPWNSGSDGAVVRVRLTPVPEAISAYVETMVAASLAGKLNRRDELPFLQIAVLLQETDGQSFDARFPVRLQRAARPLLAALGRLLGYRVVGAKPSLNRASG